MDPTALTSAYFQMWNTGQTTRVAEIVAPQWLDHGHPEVSSPEAVAASVRAVRAARPGMLFRVDAVFTGGPGLVAVVGAATSTAEPAGGTQLMWLFTVADGRLAELRTFRRSDQPGLTGGAQVTVRDH